ncbi:MAG: cytochrome c3 family protein [Armatimonadota bacterium]|nr:cytochrome c3 family protein [Armatimonadota bacterium]
MIKKYGIPALVILVLVGISLSNIIRVDGDTHTAAYKGSTLCKMCHQNTHKELVEAYLKTGHPKAFQKADAEGAIVADFSSNPVFTKDKVAYVLGKGIKQQAFLDANLQVLPAIWDVKTKKWKPTQAVDGATQCIGCHVTGYNAETKAYVEAGVGCESCHGPGGDHVSNATAKGSILKLTELPRDRQTMICGGCHSKGKDLSGKFAFPIGFKPGDDLAKFFVDAKPTTPGLNQQYSEHITSTHYTKLTMTCTTCHDPHNQSGIAHELRKPVNEQCLGCHAAKIKDMATHAPNAAADATCATCHMPYGEHIFKKLEKKEGS